ncbi:MAG: ABC transporter permease [Pyrinomonadaceae bacterium]|nr:ABC transporter permease [Pyrinomonadaceae bacterium]
MSGFWQDVRYSIRMMLKNRGVTFIAVLALALGIGANTAIFSVVNAVLLRPLPYHDPERLVRLSEDSERMPLLSVSYPDFLDWKEQSTSFESLVAMQLQSFNLSGAGGGEAERLQGRNVSPAFFPTLGVAPALGRTFTEEENKPGANRVCNISYSLWQRRFGGDAKIVGSSVTLNNEPYTIVGVMPATFRYGSPTDVFAPIGAQTDEMMMNRGNHPGIYVLGRLKQGVTIERAREEMEAIARRLAEQYPESNSGNTVRVTSLRDFFVNDIRPALLVLLGAVCFVLLIACANVANLLLARAAARGREIAVRTALGANRARVIRQLLTESVLLSLAGGATGLLLAMWGVDLLRAWAVDNLPSTVVLNIDGRVLLFTLLVSILTGIVFGLVPALQASKTDVNSALKEGGRSGTGGASRQRARNVLVVSEIALSLLLLIGAGLLMKSFLRLRGAELGFEPQQLLTMQISRSAAKPEEAARAALFFEQLEERIKSLPGVEAAAYSNGLPMLGASETSFQIVGRPKPDPDKVPQAVLFITSADYLRTMNIRILRGRFFDARDMRNSQMVAVVDEAFAKKQFAGEDPIGQHIGGNEEAGVPQMEIVGIVEHVNNYGVGVPEPVAPQMYFAFSQVPEKFISLVIGSVSFAVRTKVEPASLTATLRREVSALDPNQPVYNINTMDANIAESIASQRFSMLLLGLFAVVALVLASVGIYGVMSYSVTQRTHEIGIRMALGAQGRDVLRLVVGQGLVLCLVGVGVGLLAALILTRFLASLLYGVSAIDLVTYLAVSVLITIVAFLASYIPARRASRIDPMIALRYE